MQVVTGSVNVNGFEVLHPQVKLHGVLPIRFISKILHSILNVLRMGDYLPLLVGDREVDFRAHAANVWRSVSMVWESEASFRRASMNP